MSTTVAVLILSGNIIHSNIAFFSTIVDISGFTGSVYCARITGHIYSATITGSTYNGVLLVARAIGARVSWVV